MSGDANSPAGPTPGYRPCVGLMLLDRRGRVFVAKRNDVDADAWQMPQGGIDPGETPRQAALRELAEEIGTDKAEIIAESEDWLDYDLPPHLLGKAWGGRFRGQSVRWFALRFTGLDADIDLEAPGEAHAPEFSDWKWVALEALPGLAVDFKRPLYEALVARFRPLVEKLRAGG